MDKDADTNVSTHRSITSTDFEPISHIFLRKHRRKSIIPPSHQPSQQPKYFRMSDEDECLLSDRDQSTKEDQQQVKTIVSTIETIEETADVTDKEEIETDNSFDTFIFHNFIPFSGSQDVQQWLDETENTFNKSKIPRNLRFEAISLLLTGEAKRKYIKNRKEIQSFDDFYEFLLSEFDKTVSFSSKLSLDNKTHDYSHTFSTHRSKSLDDQSRKATNTFDNTDFSPKVPILRSTAFADLGTTSLSGEKPAIRSTMTVERDTTSPLDQTTNDLRKAILESFIKTPKTFQGGKEDVSKWLDELEHLFDVAHIPDATKLDLISYSLRGDALQWYKNSKHSLTTWEKFVKGIKKAFTSSFQEELAFKKLVSYTQGENQSIRNFYNEVLKLCTEADPTMSEATKLKHLLSKTKPTIQFEVRRNKPTTPAEFLDYAKEAEELFQLSNISIDNNNTSTPNNLTSTTAATTQSLIDQPNNAPSSNFSSQRWRNSNDNYNRNNFRSFQPTPSSSSFRPQQPNLRHFQPQQQRFSSYRQPQSSTSRQRFPSQQFRSNQRPSFNFNNNHTSYQQRQHNFPREQQRNTANTVFPLDSTEIDSPQQLPYPVDCNQNSQLEDEAPARPSF